MWVDGGRYIAVLVNGKASCVIKIVWCHHTAVPPLRPNRCYFSLIGHWIMCICLCTVYRLESAFTDYWLWFCCCVFWELAMFNSFSKKQSSVQIGHFNQFASHAVGAGGHLVTNKQECKELFARCGCHLMNVSWCPISSSDWMDAGLWPSPVHTILLTALLMTSSILYFGVAVANFYSQFRTSHHS